MCVSDYLKRGLFFGDCAGLSLGGGVVSRLLCVRGLSLVARVTRCMSFVMYGIYVAPVFILFVVALLFRLDQCSDVLLDFRTQVFKLSLYLSCFRCMLSCLLLVLLLLFRIQCRPCVCSACAILRVTRTHCLRRSGLVFLPRHYVLDKECIVDAKIFVLLAAMSGRAFVTPFSALVTLDTFRNLTVSRLPFFATEWARPRELPLIHEQVRNLHCSFLEEGKHCLFHRCRHRPHHQCLATASCRPVVSSLPSFRLSLPIHGTF